MKQKPHDHKAVGKYTAKNHTNHFFVCFFFALDVEPNFTIIKHVFLLRFMGRFRCKTVVQLNRKNGKYGVNKKMLK